MTQTKEKPKSQEVCPGHEAVGGDVKTGDVVYRNMEYADRIERAVECGYFGSALVGIDSLPADVPRDPLYAMVAAAISEKASRKRTAPEVKTIADVVIAQCKTQSKYMQ